MTTKGPKQHKSEECVYCGSRKNLTDDHVPPRAIFPKPRSSDLVTVKACQKCNAGASLDDEYFRLMLCGSRYARGSKSAKLAWQTAFRGLNRSRGKKLKEQLVSRFRTVNVDRRGGLYLGQGLGYSPDLARLGRVVGRTVRGLHFHNRRCRLAVDFGVLVWPPGTLGVDGVPEPVWNALAMVRPERIGGDVFQYRYSFGSKCPDGAVWLLTFYPAAEFFCVTMPKAMISERGYEGIAF